MERYKKVAEHMKRNNIEFTKFVGIDGIDLNDDTVKKITTKLCNKICTRSIIGCAISHILLWKHIVMEENIEYAIVMEDDCILSFNDFFSLKDILEFYLNEYSLILLDGFGSKYKNSIDLGEYRIMEYENSFSHACYMIRKNTASFLVDHYTKYGISYHIDFTDNSLLTNSGRKIGILFPGIIKNIGEYSSTMFSGNELLKIFGSNIYYSLTFPIMKFCNVLINFSTIILSLIIILFLILKIRSLSTWIILLSCFFEVITLTQ